MIGPTANGIKWRVALDAPPGVHVASELAALAIASEGHRQRPGSIIPLRTPGGPLGLLEEQERERLRDAYTVRAAVLPDWLQLAGPVEDTAVFSLLGDQLRSYPPVVPATFARRFGLSSLTDTALDSATVARGRGFDGLVVRSAWQAQLLRANGLAHVIEWAPGIDLTRFRPRPRRPIVPGRFVIWSCGRLDPRKGQDLVGAAFRAFHQRHPDALLLAAWQHPIPEAVSGFPDSAHLTGMPDLRGGTWQIVPWLERHGIPADSVVDVGLLANPQVPILLSGADVALFASRVEAEPSGALLECFASAIPAIVAAHSAHAELARPEWCLPVAADRPLTCIPAGVNGTDGWGEAAVDDLVEALESVYQDRSAARARALAASRAMTRFGWNQQMRAFFGLLDEALGSA